jgi:hypothetical protein
MEFSKTHQPTVVELHRMETLLGPESGDIISKPLVMASAAGWYIGHIYKDCYGIGPWSRESEYMTHDTAVAVWQYDYDLEHAGYLSDEDAVEAEWSEATCVITTEFEDNIPF